MMTVHGTGATRANRGRPKNGSGAATTAGFTRGEPLELAGRRALVVGLARTGLDTANFLARRGAVVTVTDRKDPAALEAALARLDPGVRRELGGHRAETFLAQDLVVPSPGMAMDDPLLVAARTTGVRILSEIELAYRFLPVPMVAVTGTNGKSTVTTALGLALEAAGIPARVGGNIGNPLIGEVDTLGASRWVVAEISSFQLEWIETFRPRIAALLNLSEDHLDRYPTYQEYLRAKLRIFERMEAGDDLVLNADDPLVAGRAAAARARAVWFSMRRIPRRGVYLFRGWIYSRLGERLGQRVLPVSEMRIAGTHNQENALAVTALALLAGCAPKHVREVFRSFRGLPHRTEFVREVGDVRWYDDSKGTNVGATARTLAGMPGRVVLILGGRDKGGGYAPLAPLVRERVRALVLLGEAREKIASELAGTAPIEVVAEMGEAVRRAAALAKPGDAVLLSPACASFDQYANYAERGRHFQAEVNVL
jgi:UDP-N-acetylmuramoylalanine--D-glutamate ligase